MSPARDAHSERRALRHTPACATGARAETRGSCNCGSHEREPAWVLRILRATDADGYPLVALAVVEQLTAREAGDLAFALEVASGECARLYWRARERSGTRTVLEARCTCGARVAGLLADCEACLARARAVGDADAPTGEKAGS